jgi:hypothetical protein
MAALAFGVVCLVTEDARRSALDYRANEDVLRSLAQIVFYPVWMAWNGVFSLLGIEGDARMAFILPMLATGAVYFALLGFSIGVLIGKLLKPQSE